MNKAGLYLCARLDRHQCFDIDYNDIEKKYHPDLCCDCVNINLYEYKYLIATPPCNYYSRANYRRETSKVAQETKHLLPYCLKEFIRSGRPFIVENVNNKNLLPTEYDKYCYRFSIGGHTFWTNVYFELAGLIVEKQNKQNVCRNKRDGNRIVHDVIDRFLQEIHKPSYEKILLTMEFGY